MKTQGRIYLIIGTVIVMMIFVSNFSFAENSKSKLIASIEEQQKKTEKEIVNLWMNRDRGKKLDIALSKYITLEVRKGALVDCNNKNSSLLSTVTKDGNYKPNNTIDVAREIVLEHYKNKGIDLKSHDFVKGDYYLQVKD